MLAILSGSEYPSFVVLGKNKNLQWFMLVWSDGIGGFLIDRPNVTQDTDYL